MADKKLSEWNHVSVFMDFPAEIAVYQIYFIGPHDYGSNKIISYDKLSNTLTLKLFFFLSLH